MHFAVLTEQIEDLEAIELLDALAASGARPDGYLADGGYVVFHVPASVTDTVASLEEDLGLVLLCRSPNRGNLEVAIRQYVAALEANAEEWDLKISPEDYLDRYPDGPHAEEARAVLGRT